MVMLLLLLQGSSKTVTNWCPLGEVPASMGPLAVLVGSNRYGQRPLIEASDLSGATLQPPISLTEGSDLRAPPMHEGMH
jgi:hypothetical protein